MVNLEKTPVIRSAHTPEFRAYNLVNSDSEWRRIMDTRQNYNRLPRPSVFDHLVTPGELA